MGTKPSEPQVPGEVPGGWASTAYSANETNHHTINCFNDLEYQHLGEQVSERGGFLSFPRKHLRGSYLRTGVKGECA